MKAVVKAPGTFEMTWSFSGPEGRATWESTTIVDALGLPCAGEGSVLTGSFESRDRHASVVVSSHESAA